MNGSPTQLVATVFKKKSSPCTTDLLAIIQVCFTLSSRVLLVSNLNRSNWKCTVKRFFKSTVMLRFTLPARNSSSNDEDFSNNVAPRCGCKRRVLSYVASSAVGRLNER